MSATESSLQSNKNLLRGTLCAMDIEIGERIYRAYLAIFDMELRDGLRREMLTWALMENPDHWPVVGVTKAALDRFAHHDFRCVSGIKIHRAHLVDRKVWQSAMLARKLELDDWLSLYNQNDRTVLATSSENMRGEGSSYIPIPMELGLFRSTGYKWRHTIAEREHLRSMHMNLDRLDTFDPSRQ